MGDLRRNISWSINNVYLMFLGHYNGHGSGQADSCWYWSKTCRHHQIRNFHQRASWHVHGHGNASGKPGKLREKNMYVFDFVLLISWWENCSDSSKEAISSSISCTNQIWIMLKGLIRYLYNLIITGYVVLLEIVFNWRKEEIEFSLFLYLNIQISGISFICFLFCLSIQLFTKSIKKMI